MRLSICGVRGSTPATGPRFVRYGGNTSCIAVGRGSGAPSLILDSGTGIRRVADLMQGAPFKGSLLLTHLHWDHTQGLPFFAAGDDDGSDVKLLMPGQGEPAAVFERMMSPPFFPIGPDKLRGTWKWQGLEPGEHDIEGFSVRAEEVPHKGGRCFGYRVSDASGSFAYVSDHNPMALGKGPDGLGEYHAAITRLASRVDLLIHDAQFTAAEMASRAWLGHASVEYAIALAERVDARRVLLFHHDPGRTDDELDDLVRRHQGEAVPVRAAKEGAIIELDTRA